MYVHVGYYLELPITVGCVDIVYIQLHNHAVYAFLSTCCLAPVTIVMYL